MKNWLKIKNLQNLSIDGENNGQYRSFSMTLCLCSTWKYLEKNEKTIANTLTYCILKKRVLVMR